MIFQHCCTLFLFFQHCDTQETLIALDGLNLEAEMPSAKKVAKKFRIYYNIPEDKDDYEVDHSLYSFFTNEKGKVVQYFSNQTTVEEIINMVTMLRKQASS